MPDVTVLERIGASEVQAALGLILRRGAHQENQFLPVLVHFRTFLPALAREAKVAENLRFYVEAKVPQQYADFKPGMAQMAVESGDFGSLADETSDWLQHLEQWLTLTGGDTAAWKAAKKLGKTDELDRYPVLKAFALAERIPAVLGRSSEGRKGLLQALIKVHGLKEEKLLELGFSASEIHQEAGKGGLFGRIRRLFGK
jgi:hypothetical protein